MLRFTYYLFLFIGIFGCAKNQQAGEQLLTANDLWQAHPERMRSLFDALDTEQAVLQPVKTGLAAGDTVAAAEALLQHYRQADRSWVVRALGDLPEADVMTLANGLLVDSVLIHGVPDKMPLLENGGWQWNHTGPDKDDEFGYTLNGHNYLPALLQAWKNTGDATYIAAFDRIVKDWVVQHPLPAAGDSVYVVLDPSQKIDWRDIGEVEWRTLETGNRLGATWPQLFYSLQGQEEFSAAARLLMLSSIADQAAYLRQYHKRGHNWTTMEMNGLALSSLAFPEFKAANAWADYALATMTQEINRQVYPDGLQTEISTKTQWVALRRFESVADHFENAGRQVSEKYLDRLEEMYHYLAYSMRPDGYQPINNDSDREDLRPRMLVAAKKFNRPDWQYIATNGREGTLPEQAPTITFPWAGIHVMRNGWQGDAHWAFFDTGPYGTGHQHRDKLHLSVTAFGRDLLVDGGRYTHMDYFSFDPKNWRGYFRSSFSHNVILVDGNGQKEGPVRTGQPLSEGLDYRHEAGYDYAWGSFTDGYENVEGETEHSRSVLYLRDHYWIVLDHFRTDRPRQLQVLWHYAPDSQVSLEGNVAVSARPDAANLRIVPLGSVNWQGEIVSGQETPVIQGWYSADYGTKVPNPTVVYSAPIEQSVTFAWLLVPAQGTVPVVDAQCVEKAGIVNFTIRETDQSPVQISLPLARDAAKVVVKQ